MSAAVDLGKAVAVASLPAVGPRRLRLLCAGGPVASAFDRVARGDLPGSVCEVGSAWPALLADTDVDELGAATQRLGIDFVDAGSEHYPESLRDDPEGPALLFFRGHVGVVGGPSVAIVGTRRATPYGRRVAALFARELTFHGVSVISGLAAGIDGAAHEAAIAAVRSGAMAAPVGVVGSGLDVVYPRRHAGLWSDVASAGVLFSEAPPGARPEPWRFPLRNRILAALADVVVVVESGCKGGSLHTVEAALARGRTVMAVPGPVSSPASEGTNALLSAGAVVASSTDDILTALALVARPALAGASAADPSWPAPAVANGRQCRVPVAGIPAGAALSAPAQQVLAAVQVEALLTDELVVAVGLPLLDVVRALGELEALGLSSREGARWHAGRVA